MPRGTSQEPTPSPAFASTTGGSSGLMPRVSSSSMIWMQSSTQWTISTTWAAELRNGLVTIGFRPSFFAASLARGWSWSKLLFSRASAPTM